MKMRLDAVDIAWHCAVTVVTTCVLIITPGARAGDANEHPAWEATAIDACDRATRQPAADTEGIAPGPAIVVHTAPGSSSWTYARGFSDAADGASARSLACVIDSPFRGLNRSVRVILLRWPERTWVREELIVKRAIPVRELGAVIGGREVVVEAKVDPLSRDDVLSLLDDPRAARALLPGAHDLAVADSTIAVADSSRITLFDANVSRVREIDITGAEVVALSADGRYLAADSPSSPLRVWRTDSTEVLREGNLYSLGRCSGLHFTAGDSPTLVTICRDYLDRETVISSWDFLGPVAPPETPPRRRSRQWPFGRSSGPRQPSGPPELTKLHEAREAGAPNAVATAPRGDHIAVLHGDEALVWDAAGRRAVARIPGLWFAARWDGSGRRLALSGDAVERGAGFMRHNKVIIVWDLDAGGKIGEATEPSISFGGGRLAFSADAALLAHGEAHTIRVLDGVTLKQLGRINPAGQVMKLAFMGRRLIGIVSSATGKAWLKAWVLDDIARSSKNQ